MKFSLIDILIISSIFLVVGYYIFLRYREEKKKEKINYVPMLLSYLEKFEKEKEEFIQRAEDFKSKLESSKRRLEEIRKKVDEYKWKKRDIERLKKLKRTEFETIFTGIFEILGYDITEPAIYKDHNIDFILTHKDKKICLDFIDYQKIKNLNEKYIETLLQGKQKYECTDIWIITNSKFSEKLEKLIKDNCIKIMDIDDIIQTLPSLRIFDDYFDEKTIYHNYELLYKETYDEIIRRNEWIDEVNKKLAEHSEKIK